MLIKVACFSCVILIVSTFRVFVLTFSVMPLPFIEYTIKR